MRRSKKKIAGFTIIGILILIIAFAVINFSAILHVYHGLTLFSGARLSDNFRNMDQRFPSAKVAASDNPSAWDYDEQTLPDVYEHDGEWRQVKQFVEGTGTTGLLIAQGNTILHESYHNGYASTDRMITWSVSKSVISALIGIAVEEGSIDSLQDPVTDYVPSLSVSGYDGVSIENVLRMSSGISFNEDYFDNNSDVNRMGALSIGLGGSLESLLVKLESEMEPGLYHRYASSDTQVLGMVLRAATGESIAAFTQGKLWEPAGMEFDAYWLTDSTGVESAFGGFSASLRDLARFATLYLHDEMEMDQAIIPRAWVNASVRTDASKAISNETLKSEEALNYGYQWWIPAGNQNDFLAMGIYGQALYVNPDLNIVIAKTSAYTDYDDHGKAMELESIDFFRHLASFLHAPGR